MSPVPPDPPAGREGDAAGRDRDTAGRPRNARPRDGLGRPLPHGADGDIRIPDDLSLSPAQSLEFAQRLLDENRPFHAHEVLEASWKAAPARERELWQGLAQIAVGLTHARRGNARGAIALLSRGAERVRGYQDRAGSPVAVGQPASPFGMNVASFLAAADDLAARIERDGLDAVPPADLSPGLLPGAP